MADFTPKPPDFNLYWSDDEGNIDFKDRSRQSGLWASEKVDKNGNKYYTGKVKDTNRRFVMYTFVPKDQREQDEEPEW